MLSVFPWIGSIAFIITTMLATTTIASTFPVTIKDAAGIEHHFTSPPKIGCEWSGCVEVLADIGIKPYAVANALQEELRSTFYYPLGKPKYNIEDSKNPEDWAAADVDVILTRLPSSRTSLSLNAAAPVFHLHHPGFSKSNQTGYHAFIENIKLVGLLTGESEKALAALQRFKGMIANLKAKGTDETGRLTVAVIGSNNRFNPLGPESPFCSLIHELNLGLCLGEGGEKQQLNAEMFLKWNPDWIVYGAGNRYQDRNTPIWKRLGAVRKGQIYNAQGNRYYCCSTRGLIHAMQEYTHKVIDKNVPAPGNVLEFVVENSPLIDSPLNKS